MRISVEKVKWESEREREREGQKIMFSGDLKKWKWKCKENQFKISKTKKNSEWNTKLWGLLGILHKTIIL